MSTALDWIAEMEKKPDALSLCYNEIRRLRGALLVSRPPGEVRQAIEGMRPVPLDRRYSDQFPIVPVL